MDFNEVCPEQVKSVWMYNSSRRSWAMLFGSIAGLSLVVVTISIAVNGVADVPLFLVLLIVVLLCLVRVIRNGVRVSEEGLAIRRLRGRMISWSSIEEIGIRRVQGMRQAQVIVNGGRVRNLPVPSDRWPLREEQFDEKLDLLRRYWVAYR